MATFCLQVPTTLEIPTKQREMLFMPLFFFFFLGAMSVLINAVQRNFAFSVLGDLMSSTNVFPWCAHTGKGNLEQPETEIYV